MIEVVVIGNGEPVSDNGLRSHVRTLDLRVPSVTDDTPVGMTGPSWALFGRREIAVVVDLGSMRVLRRIVGVTGCAVPPAMCGPMTSMWQAIDDAIMRQGGTVGDR